MRNARRSLGETDRQREIEREREVLTCGRVIIGPMTILPTFCQNESIAFLIAHRNVIANVCNDTRFIITRVDCTCMATGHVSGVLPVCAVYNEA